MDPPYLHPNRQCPFRQSGHSNKRLIKFVDQGFDRLGAWHWANFSKAFFTARGAGLFVRLEDKLESTSDLSGASGMISPSFPYTARSPFPPAPECLRV